MKKEELLKRIADIKKQAMGDRQERIPVKVDLVKGGPLFGFYEYFVHETLKLEVPLSQEGKFYHRIDPVEIEGTEYFPLEKALEALNNA